MGIYLFVFFFFTIPSLQRERTFVASCWICVYQESLEMGSTLKGTNLLLKSKFFPHLIGETIILSQLPPLHVHPDTVDIIDYRRTHTHARTRTHANIFTLFSPVGIHAPLRRDGMPCILWS